MRTVIGRIAKLEDRLGTSERNQPLILVISPARQRLALDEDRCLQILDECGFLPTGLIGHVNFGQIPGGLNAEELERFLRERGAETCHFYNAQIMADRQAPASGRLYKCPGPDSSE